MIASKNILYSISAAVLIGLLLSCQSRNSKFAGYEDNIEVIIRIEDNIKNFKPLSLCQMNAKIEYIALETTQGSSLGSIHHFDMDDRNIVISDRTKALNFTPKGSFIGQIGSVGKTTGEYYYPSSCQVYGDGIYLSCFARKRIIAYDRNGQFRFEVPIKFNVGIAINQNTFLPLPKDQFLVHVPNHSGIEPYTLVIINHQGEILKGVPNTAKYEKYNKGFSSLTSDVRIYRFGKNIRFKHRINDTLWQLHLDTLIPKYILDRGKHKVPTHLWGYSYESPELKAVIANMLIYVWLVTETTDYIIFRTRFGKLYPFSFRRSATSGPAGPIEPKHEILGVYNKQTQDFFFVSPSGEDYQLEPLGIENDIDGGINFAPMYSPNERTLVSWFNAMDLKAHVESDGFKNSKPKYPERKRELEALAHRLKYDDNPVLMVVTLGEDEE